MKSLLTLTLLFLISCNTVDTTENELLEVEMERTYILQEENVRFFLQIKAQESTIAWAVEQAKENKATGDTLISRMDSLVHAVGIICAYIKENEVKNKK
jgi:hypothetical protein